MKEHNGKIFIYVVTWLLVVLLCGLLGDIFPSQYQTQAKYDLFEEKNWIIYPMSLS